MSELAYAELYRRSVESPEAFWAEQAQSIDWHRRWDTVLDRSRPPFATWFVGGQTNLCHNAVDRHLATRADQPALIYVSTETGQEQQYTYAELHREVQIMAASLQSLGVAQGDRVLIYMPMIPEAVFAMLACVRLGAVHSVVFGGFASVSLAARIDDARPKVIVSADAGSRGGKVVPYKPLLDEALRLSQHAVARVVVVDRGLANWPQQAARDVSYATLRAQHVHEQVPCVWVDSAHPSYILYTSGTTGKPKGVQRDTGGYAVAMRMSMRVIFGGSPGETFFSTSDIGWVVGHSYIVYAPLLTGMTTVLYEGTPIRPDAAIFWRLVEQYRVNLLFSAPTAMRVLKRHDPALLHRHDLSSLRAIFLAGEPLDEPTGQWVAESLGKPVIDNYWQTETGWPILATPQSDTQVAARPGSPGVAMPGYKVVLRNETDGSPVARGEKGVLTIDWPLPPGCLQTVWGNDQRFVDTYWSTYPNRQVYSTFDWGRQDADDYFYILGRTDDVINVAGHRLGTREIEESISAHPAVAEVAVVGVQDALKGQAAWAFVVLRPGQDGDAAAQQAAIAAHVDAQLGAVARPQRICLVTALPKTRSGKMLRRAIQAICEGRDPGDLTTLEDPLALQQIPDAIARS
ncbi:propionate--CoA ligase [Thiomonas sp.]|uniref:propionate--CoA ligase n=1 Tax=Thiomonas sp. TaxID=2047785 RepID=UPI0026383F55|nr:propionate--CoA ligase [Thiomonas sp.]